MIKHYDTRILRISVDLTIKNGADYLYYEFEYNKNIHVASYNYHAYYGIWLYCTSPTDRNIINTVFNYLDCGIHYTMTNGLTGV